MKKDIKYETQEEKLIDVGFEREDPYEGNDIEMKNNFKKGFKEKEQILRESLKGVATVIVDPYDEYNKSEEMLNGKVGNINGKAKF